MAGSPALQHIKPTFLQRDFHFVAIGVTEKASMHGGQYSDLEIQERSPRDVAKRKKGRLGVGQSFQETPGLSWLQSCQVPALPPLHPPLGLLLWQQGP